MRGALSIHIGRQTDVAGCTRARDTDKECSPQTAQELFENTGNLWKIMEYID
jgi:hypothetical protein